MSENLPPEIKSGLGSLRRRIRQIQLFRGLLRTFGVVLGGLILIVALDYFLAPLSLFARGGLFFIWLTTTLVAGVCFILRPIMGALPLVRLARWLEDRHPETQERISTAIELADHPEGGSPGLLAELSKEAARDMEMIDPRKEVQTKRVRKSMVPVGAAFIALMTLVGVWPREMGRLITRAISPFSELGNAGAFRFDIQPGDVGCLEGDELTIDLSYTGLLEKPLELVMEKNGETLIESLEPTNSEGETHNYAYRVYSLDVGFKYYARVAGSESDRFEAKVYPLPRLLEPVVALQYPPYTAWPDREISLGTGVQALAGTKVTVKGRFDTPLEGGELVMDSASFGEVSLASSARGTAMTWSEVLKPGLDSSATLKVKHRLGHELEAAQFHLQAIEDPAPEVKILTPVQREFRVKPNEQVIITYEVREGIGLAKAEIELEVNGKRVNPLLELLPELIDGENGRLWEGEAMVFLGSLVLQNKGAQQFRMRLALHDNRPTDLEGPGVGHSEWLEFKLDENAESLVRQELRKQESDIRETIEKVIRDIQKAREKMYQAKSKLHEEEISERTEKSLTESREQLKEAQKDLTELAERMKQGVQAHRRDDVEAVVSKIEEARKSVENTPLQDTPESRHAEMEHALRESEEAMQDLRKLREKVQKDQPKTDDLARLQEMAHRQEELARQASVKDRDQDWQKKQQQMQEEIRQKIQQSPKAKAVAMKSQSEQALDLVKEAEALQTSQEELAKLTEGISDALEQALAREQETVVEGIKFELTEARAAQEARANHLPEALAQAEAALEGAQEGDAQAAAEAAQKAARELSKKGEVSSSQMALQAKQQEIYEALQDLAEGRPAEALVALEEMQAKRAAELAQDIQSIPEVEGNPLGQAQQQAMQGSQKASQARQSQQAGQAKQASQQHQQAAQKFAETSQSLKKAAQQMAQRAEQAAKEPENSRRAPAPGESMAEALEQSSKAAHAADSQEAASSAKAAGEALRQAANQAKASMKKGGKPGQEMAQTDEEGAPGQGEQLADEAKEGMREAQGDQGVPPELAKLGISTSDWEKIQATMTSDVSGSSRSVVPEDYRGLVKKYFEQITKKR